MARCEGTARAVARCAAKGRLEGESRCHGVKVRVGAKARYEGKGRWLAVNVRADADV